MRKRKRNIIHIVVLRLISIESSEYSSVQFCQHHSVCHILVALLWKKLLVRIRYLVWYRLWRVYPSIMAKWLFRCAIYLIALLNWTHSVHSMRDPISIIGRLKWNYTQYEENLWVREYTNRTLNEIYIAHEPYFRIIFGETDLLTTTSVPMKHRLIDAFMTIKRTWSKMGILLQQQRYDEIRTAADSIVLNITISMNAILSPTNQENYFDDFFLQVLFWRNVFTL